MRLHIRYPLGFLLLSANLSGAMPLDPGTAARIASAKGTALTLALLKAARETDCPEYLQQAGQSVSDALRTAPDNFEAHKARVALLLAQSRYAEALAEAQALNKKVPDDNLLKGYLADAYMAQGDYSAAEKFTQRMIDQRPVNAPGFERGAQLRDDFGYGDPSLDWWNSALRITSFSDLEERAWILSNMSRVALRMGKAADAVKDARAALNLIADYPLASDTLAAALIRENQAGEAVGILEKRLRLAPNVRAEFHYAEALELAGRRTEAAQAFERFEKLAVAQESQPDNANRELMEYYATHDRAQDAVRLGEQEAARRHDIFTLSAYAQALAAAGEYSQARIAIDRALDPGIRDAALFLRAGMIAAKLNDKPAAANYLKKAIELNAATPEAEKALHLLANLT